MHAKDLWRSPSRPLRPRGALEIQLRVTNRATPTSVSEGPARARARARTRGGCRDFTSLHQKPLRTKLGIVS